MDVAKQIQSMFEDPVVLPKAEMPGPADAYRQRVQAALLAHAEGQAVAKRQNPFGYKEKPCDTFGRAGKVPEKPKKSKRDLNPRARAAIRREGLIPDRLERWDAERQIHRDYLGGFDFIGNNETRKVAIQVTTKKNASARRLKLIESGALEKAKRRGYEVALLLFENPGQPKEEIWEWL